MCRRCAYRGGSSRRIEREQVSLQLACCLPHARDRLRSLLPHASAPAALVDDDDAVGTAHGNVGNAVAVAALVDGAPMVVLDRYMMDAGLERHSVAEPGEEPVCIARPVTATGPGGCSAAIAPVHWNIMSVMIAISAST